MRSILLMGLILAAAAVAAEVDPVTYSGRPVAEVIDEFRDAGHPFAYSTNLVTADLRVTVEPDSDDAVEIVLQILQPHDLTLHTEAGVHIVVRIVANESPRDPRSRDDAIGASSVADAAIETIFVSASRYEILRDMSASRFSIDQRTIENMPDLGEDPMRVVQRLPGAAASGASAMTHFRGGEHGEIGIMLNGKWLFDPFHIRDYQSIFSAIDARAIEGVEVYTGGFPVRFGDRMSGLVLTESLESVKPRHTEIGLSVFNASVLTAGREADRSWLVSARRGNLDLVIDPQFGEPSYYDVFGEFTYDVSDNTTLSFNALFADDSVRVVLESDPEELEQVSSRTKNVQLWVTLDNRWSDALTSRIVLSAVSFDNLRDGSLGDEEKIVATVFDERDVQQAGFRQDWTWQPSDTHIMQWGFRSARHVGRSSRDKQPGGHGRARWCKLFPLLLGSPQALG
jgi:hypothetical protein